MDADLPESQIVIVRALAAISWKEVILREIAGLSTKGYLPERAQK